MSEPRVALSRPGIDVRRGVTLVVLVAFLVAALGAVIVPSAWAAAPEMASATAHASGGEANLRVPDLAQVSFSGINGRTLLLWGLLVCVFGLLFGLVIFVQLRNLAVHRAMREISELIYETCKTYLITQGKFILILWVFIAVIVVAYFGILRPVPGHSVALTVPMILFFSLIGIGGSYGVAWFGIRVNTFANSRTAFASLEGKPYPIYAIPLKAGMSIGMLLTGVALITFILLAVPNPTIQIQLLVWIFVMRVMMLVSSAVSYFVNAAIAKARYSAAGEMNFEAPLTTLVWLTSIVSIALTYIVSYLVIPVLAGDRTLWWKLGTIISCGTLAGAVIPELVKVFTSTESRHVQEIVKSANEGGASLNILAGLVAGNYSAYWLGISMVGLMAIAYIVSTTGLM